MSLQKKTISGLFWTFSQQFSVQLISFVVSIILARLLIPAEFGLIAMIAIFIGIGNILIDSGLTSSLIRTNAISQRDLSTVFYVNVISSIVIYLIIFFFAPAIAAFYKQPALRLIIRVYTLSFIINSFATVQATLLSKEMNFKKQMIIQIPIVIVSGVAGIIMAYNGLGVWTFVWMNLINASLNVLLHWINSEWYPKLIFDWPSFRKHIKFGYKLMFSGLLDQFFENLYAIIIGRFFSPGSLAMYNRAYTLQMLPVQNISSALTKVTYPLFAKIQDDDEKLRSAYQKILIQVIFWTVPVMLIMQLSAKPLISFLLTDKWLGAVPYLRILCFCGILYPLHIYNLNILLVKGRSDLFFKLEIVKKIVFVSGIPLFFIYKIEGLAWWLLINSVISFFINSFYSGKFIRYNVFAQIRDILPAFLLGFSIWLVCNLIKMPTFPGQNNFLQILLYSTIFFVSYLSISFILKMKATEEIKQIIRTRKLS
jgi:O-antigen/teichoic acid export membrane protein